MADIKKLLVPTDFSEASNHALAYAIDLAKALGAELELMHAYEIPAFTVMDGGMVASADMVTRISDAAQKQLDVLRDNYASSGVELRIRLLEGAPYDEIVREAIDTGADLIVMGTHGRTGLEHALVGSVAERVVRLSKLPVLTVRAPQ